MREEAEGLPGQVEAVSGVRDGEVLRALLAILAMTKSHIDGRDLLAELHPRKELDIKRRVDGRETWFEGDWLSNLWDATRAAEMMLRERGLSQMDRSTANAWALGVLRQEWARNHAGLSDTSGANDRTREDPTS
jgi:hypothetical protein